MNRKELISKLVKEGFSETTLCNFNDKQLEKFANKILAEGTLNIPKKDQAAIKAAQDQQQTFVTYEEKNIEEFGPKPGLGIHQFYKQLESEKISIDDFLKNTEKGSKKLKNLYDFLVKDQGYSKAEIKNKKKENKSEVKKESVEEMPNTADRRSGTKKKKAFNAEKLNEFVDNTVDNAYHSLTTKGEMVELIKNKISVLSEKQDTPKIPEFMEGVEVAEPAVKPEVKPAPSKPDTDSPRREKPAHPGQRPVDPNKNPLPDPAPKAKAISGDEAKSKIIQMVHKIFTQN